MSRLTGTDAYSLMEAYNNVYTPQELTEEQVWEEVENWVNDLIEEGYDLSDYTWEEMYESYLEEMGQRMTTGQATAPRGSSPATPQPQLKGLSIGKGGFNINNKPVNTGISPIFQRPGTKPAPSTSRPSGSAPATRPAAPAPAARPSGGASAPRPAAAAAPAAAAPKVAPTKPAATPSGGSALDRATAAASKPAAFSPKPQSDVGAMIARSQARQSAQTPTPAAKTTPAAKQTPMQKRLNMEMEYDTFDSILEHLVAEGYADTEEAALKIMVNMSGGWRESIVEAQEARNNPEKYEDEQRKKKSKKQRAMDDPHTGINSPAFAAFMKQQGR